MRKVVQGQCIRTLSIKMAQIYNSDLTKEILAGAKIQINRDSIPNQLAEKVVPVMEVNPKLLRRINQVFFGACTNAVTQVIHTTKTDLDFYLCGGSLSFIKDATSTSTYSIIQCVLEDNSTVYFLYLPQITLTANFNSISIALPFPIKLKKGSNISIVNETNVANIKSAATVYGYYDDMSKA